MVMSKLTRESIEKAEKLLGKKQEYLDVGLIKEIETRLSRSVDLANELRTLKEAAREKRLDIEDNARALGRLANKAKRAVEVAAAAKKAEAKNAKRDSPASKGVAPKKTAAPKSV